MANGSTAIQAHLVVHVGDVHDEVDIVAEVIAKDAAQDVLSHVVSEGGMSKGQYESDCLFPAFEV